MEKPFIVFVTGASGVGKTTLINNLKKKHSQNNTWQFEQFDTIGVPSPEEMVKRYGSSEEWQNAMTREWVKKIVTGYPDKKVLILEGQMNLDFIKDAFQKNNFENYGIVLIDADEEDMMTRLADQRNQPELANQNMKNWLVFLRKQAIALQTPIINTSNKGKGDVVHEFEQVLNQLLM